MKFAHNILSELDFERLLRVIENLSKKGNIQYQLEKKIDNMEIVEPESVPSDLITMNSELICEVNAPNGDCLIPQKIKLVYPSEANFEHGKVSILTPLGTALLGAKAGISVSWNGLDGIVRSLRLNDVIYQPEANGDWHL